MTVNANHRRLQRTQTVERRDPDRRTWPAASRSRSSFSVGLYPAPVCSTIASALNPAEVTASTAPASRRVQPHRPGEAASPGPSASAWRDSGSACSRHRARRRLVRACQRMWRRVAACVERVGRGREPVVVASVAPAGTRPSVRGPSSAAFTASSTAISAARSARRPSIAARSRGCRTCGEGTHNQRGRCHEQQKPPLRYTRAARRCPGNAPRRDRGRPVARRMQGSRGAAQSCRVA